MLFLWESPLVIVKASLSSLFAHTSEGARQVHDSVANRVRLQFMSLLIEKSTAYLMS